MQLFYGHLQQTMNIIYIYIYIHSYPQGPYVKVIAMMSQAQSAEEIFPSRWKFASPFVQQELSLLNKMNAQLDSWGIITVI